VNTILFTVCGQIILKWRIKKTGWAITGSDFLEKIKCYCELLFDQFVLFSLVSAFMAFVFWTMAMTKFEITIAYPFMSLAPAIVFIFGIFILNETFTVGKIIGLVLIILGTIVTVKF
jgi:undecaprenyl phosphate-alpha-L-ara4N flippase subunit ArnF